LAITKNEPADEENLLSDSFDSYIVEADCGPGIYRPLNDRAYH